MEITIPKWEIKANYVETCNCDYGCPCNFSGWPTGNFCRALDLFHIERGSFGETRLDGIDVIFAASWPKAIHEGSGTLQIYVSRETNTKQREAITRIFHGDSKGTGPFALLRGTFKYFLEPQFVEIKRKIDGKNSSFAVPGVLEVQIEPHKNPVTGEEADAEIHLPKGFIWQVAKACKSKVMRIVTPNISFDHSGKNAFFSETVAYKGP